MRSSSGTAAVYPPPPASPGPATPGVPKEGFDQEMLEIIGAGVSVAPAAPNLLNEYIPRQTTALRKLGRNAIIGF